MWSEVDEYLILLQGAMRRLYSGQGERNFAALPDLPESAVRDAVALLEQAGTHLAAACQRRDHPLLSLWAAALAYALSEARLRLSLFSGGDAAGACGAWRATLAAEELRSGAGVLHGARTHERVSALHQEVVNAAPRGT